MSGSWKTMLGLADALQVSLEMKYGGIKQTQKVRFRVKGTAFEYGVDLVHGYVSPDYETAACVFHIGGDGYLLVEKNGRHLDFRLLDMTGQDEERLAPKSKSPRAVIKAARQFERGKLGTSTIDP